MSNSKTKHEYDPEFETYWKKESVSMAVKLLEPTIKAETFKVILFNAWLKGYNCGMQNAIDRLKNRTEEMTSGHD